MTLKNRKLSNGKVFSAIKSVPKISKSKHAVYIQDAEVDGMDELYSVDIEGGEPIKQLLLILPLCLQCSI